MSVLGANVPASEESWQAKYDRITRQWGRLAQRAKAWCDGTGSHQMGPLHRQHQDSPVDHIRRARCKKCRTLAWVKLDGTLTGFPSYAECPVAKQQREFQARMRATGRMG